VDARSVTLQELVLGVLVLAIVIVELVALFTVLGP
jgi:hypothetical protein